MTEQPATVGLWDALAQPVDPWSAAEAMVGLSSGAAHLLAAILLLASPEAEALLGALPELSRSLAIGTGSRPVRSAGEIRGPILWSETLAAQSSGADGGSSYVYAVPARVYDTPENRVLVAALGALADAGRLVDTRALRERDSDMGRLLTERAVSARRWLDHRALSGLRTTKLAARDRQRTRGARRRRYGVACELLDRDALPLSAEDLALVADDRTRAQHRGLLVLLEALRNRGIHVPPLAAHSGTLVGGPLTYIHERSRQARAESRAGIFLNGVPIDVRCDDEPTKSAGDAAALTGRVVLGSADDVPAVLRAAGL